MNSTSHGCWSSLEPKPVVPVNANHLLQPVVGNPRSVSFSKEAQCSIQERLRRGRKRCDNWRIGYLGIAAVGKTVTLLQSRVDCPSASSPSADLETQNKKGAVSIHCEWPFFYRLMRRFIKGYRHKFSLQHYNTWDGPMLELQFYNEHSRNIFHCGGFHHSWATESTDSLLSSSRLYRERT